MTRIQRVLLVVISLAGVESSAMAQTSSVTDAPIARSVRIGSSLDAFGVWTGFGGGGLAFADVRVGFPFARRFTLESFASIPRKEYESFFGVYGFQVKQRVVRASSQTREVFATYGGIGVYEHTRAHEWRYTTSAGRTDVYTTPSHTFVSPPLMPMVGAGVEQWLSDRFAIRFDGQGIVWPYPVAVIGRVSAGVSVALGRGTP